MKTYGKVGNGKLNSTSFKYIEWPKLNQSTHSFSLPESLKIKKLSFSCSPLNSLSEKDSKNSEGSSISLESIIVEEELDQDDKVDDDEEWNKFINSFNDQSNANESQEYILLGFSEIGSNDENRYQVVFINFRTLKVSNKGCIDQDSWFTRDIF